MKKLLLWALALFVAVCSTTITAGYFYARAHLSEIPVLVQQNLKTQGINFNFESVEVAKAGLSLTFKALSIEGKNFEYPILSPSARFSIRLIPAFKPIIVGLNLENPKVRRVPATEPLPPKNNAPTGPHYFLGPLLGLVQFELAISHADFPDFGVQGVNAAVRVKSLKLGFAGLEGARLSHDILVEKLTAYDWVPSLHTEGNLVYDKGSVAVQDSTIELGAFRFGVNAQVGLEKKNWKVEVALPETELSSASKYISSRATGWLSKVGGKLGVKVEAEGTGFAPNKDLVFTTVKGNLLAKQLLLTVNHPQARGDVSIDADGKFAMSGKDPQGNFNIKADLEKTEISKGDFFHKAKGIPFSISGSGTGKDRSVTFDNFAIAFHNLHAQGKGLFALSENPSGSFDVKIEKTALDGWEAFFPRYSDKKSQGTVMGTLSYQGPLKEWAKAKIQTDIKAQDVTFPLVSEWFGTKNFQAEGIAKITSNTQLGIDAGSVQTVGIDTSIDLSEAELKSGELFEKKKRTPFQIKLVVASNGKRAEVKRGTFQLGEVTGNLAGFVDSLQKPQANLNYQIAPFAAEVLRQLSPTARKSFSSAPSGHLSLKGKITGPLLDAKKPTRYDSQLTFKRFGFQYELASKKKIDVQNISGTLLASKTGLSANRMVFQTSGSSALINLKVVSFENPDIFFSVKADRFRLADFYESSESKKSVGFVAVPSVSAPSALGKTEDFRKNPWLKKLKLVGDVSLRNADLGYTKSELVTARLTYDNLVLHIDPLSIKTFGGTVTTGTHWDGRKDHPVSSVTLKADNVDANQFLGNWSDKVKDIIFGRLNTQIQIGFSGLTPEEFKKSARGGGTFTLNDGQIKTVKLTEKPLEALRKLPGMGNLSGGNIQEKLSQINGSMKVENGKMLFSDLVVRGNQFDAQTAALTVDFDLNLSGTLAWFPKEALVGSSVYELLKDESGRANLPLNLSGSLLAPSFGVDPGIVASRLQQNAARKLSNELKTKIPGDLEKKLKEGLKGLFKP